MKRIIIVLLAVLAVGQFCSGQDALRVPDNDDILSRTIDSSSPYYLPSLMGRYLASGRDLTDQDYYYLYYGYAFSDAYKPFKSIPAEDKLLGIMEAAGANPTVSQMEEVVKYGLEVMKDDPFSPKNLNFLAYAYGALGDTIAERDYFERLNHVLRTIDLSGTGVKESSPKHILRYSHAADLLYSKGLDIKRREVVSRTAEFIFLPVKDAAGNKGYYFDFSRLYQVRPDENETPKKERGWQINDMPLK